MYFSQAVLFALTSHVAVHFAAAAPTTANVNTVLIPLYLYPVGRAWDPLYQALTAHPKVHFTVIVNPSSGPGSAMLPSADYMREIPKLNAHANVQTVGYVRTSYGKRDEQAILEDISTYSKWANASSNPKLAVGGIFFDETPNDYDASNGAFYHTIHKYAKSSPGLGKCLTIFNPGTFTDSRYTSIPDLTVIFENTFQAFQTAFSSIAPSGKMPRGREGSACLVHSVPANLDQTDFTNLAREVLSPCGDVFLTELDTNFYSSFGPSWNESVRALE